MSQFPNILAGQAITAALLHSMLPYSSNDQPGVNLPVTSTTMTTINNTAFNGPAAAGTLGFMIFCQYTGGQAAGSAHFQLAATGGSASSSCISAIFFSGTTFGAGQQAAALGPVFSPVLSTAGWTMVAWGQTAVAAGTTLALQAAEGTASDTFTVNNALLLAWQIS